MRQLSSRFLAIAGLICAFADFGVALGNASTTLEDTTLKVESVEQQARALLRFGMASVSEASRNSIGLARDRVRLANVFSTAERHLSLGDAERADKLVRSEMARGNEFDVATLGRAYRILFEANRSLGRHEEAARVCLRALSRAYPVKKDERETFHFDEKWSTSCALSFAKGTLALSKSLTSLSEEEVVRFVASPLLKHKSSYQIPRAMLLATALRNVGLNSKALEFLHETIKDSPANDPWNARGYAMLGLLYDLTGDVQNSLRTLRAVVGDLSAARAELVPFTADKYTSFVANLSLARVYFRLGQVDEAKKRYLAALSAKDVFIAGKSLEKEYLSVQRFFPYSEEKVRWELANAYYYLNKKKEAQDIFAELLKEKLTLTAQSQPTLQSSVDANALLYARVLNGDPATSANAQALLSKLFGYADADYNFVSTIKNRDRSASLDVHEGRAQALLSLAKAHRVDVPEVRRLAMFRDVLQRGNAFVEKVRDDLSDALAPVDNASQGILEARELATLTRLQVLQNELATYVKDLDLIHRASWREGNSAALGYAELHRKEIFRRFEVQNDELEKILFKKNQNQTERRHLKNQKELEALDADLLRIFAISQTTSVASDTLKRNQLAGASVDFSLPNATQTNADAVGTQVGDLRKDVAKLWMEQRVYGLQANSVWRELPLFARQFVLFSASMRDLYALHQRMMDARNDGEGNELRKRLEMAWEKVFASQLAIATCAQRSVQEMQQRRREIVGRAHEIMRIADMEERGLARLKASLKQEYQTHLPKVAAKLEPVVRQYREEVRIAIADGDELRAKEGENALQSLHRARDERLQWLRSLRQSVEWGYSR